MMTHLEINIHIPDTPSEAQALFAATLRDMADHIEKITVTTEDAPNVHYHPVRSIGGDCHGAGDLAIKITN